MMGLKRKIQQKNRRAQVLLIGALIIAAVIILISMGILGSISEYYEKQDYKEYACMKMRESQDTMAVEKDPFWVFGKEIKAKPFEAAVGVSSCGAVLPLVTNNTGNITELIVNYSKEACGYGNNNTFEGFTWVRSLPVNVTNGNIDYARIVLGAPPGINPCYLIWRINASYVEAQYLIDQIDDLSDFSSLETSLANGTIKANTVTILKIDYFTVGVDIGDFSISADRSCKGKDQCFGIIEIGGLPS